MTPRHAEIESMKRQLKSVMEDLDAMPRERAGSEWHLDRVREAEWLFGRLDRLMGLDLAPLPR